MVRFVETANWHRRPDTAPVSSAETRAHDTRLEFLPMLGR
jgi:hypothetical protein